MIVGQRYVYRERDTETKFVIARNDQCEAVYWKDRLPGFSWTEPFYHEFGNHWMSLLYFNRSSHRMTDEELVEIGRYVHTAFLFGRDHGAEEKQRELRKALGI